MIDHPVLSIIMILVVGVTMGHEFALWQMREIRGDLEGIKIRLRSLERRL